MQPERGANRLTGILECLDEPPEVAESLFYLEALKKVEKYEPRVEISDMQFENTQGSMTVYIGFAVTGEL